MRLNQSEESGSRLGQAVRTYIELMCRGAVFVFWFFVVSIIATGVFLFGRIVWWFLLMLLRALGE
jgi:hypothetical protein